MIGGSPSRIASPAAPTMRVISLAPMRHRDDVLTSEGVLPVLAALRDLLPNGGLQRGSVVSTADWGLLSLALAADATAAGAWCAVAGVPVLGVRAAADAGLDPGRLVLIADPGRSWPHVVASLLDGFDIVLLHPPEQPPAQLRRKLEAAARRYGSVLLVAGDWPGAQTRLAVTDEEWTGIGTGHGWLHPAGVRESDRVAAGCGCQDQMGRLPRRRPGQGRRLMTSRRSSRWRVADEPGRC